MSILITGGTGYVGRSVVRELAATGEEIVLLARAGSDAGELPPNVRVARGDVTSLDDVATAMRGCSTVVHMAAYVALWDRDPDRYRRINVGGLRSVLKAASFGVVERIVYTSTILALGATDAPGEVADATRVAQNPVPRNRYMETKAEALAVAREAMADGAPMVVLHPGIVYGPGPARDAGLMTKMLADLMAGRLPGLVGPADRRWCHAYTDDVARGHRLALERFAEGRSYVLGGPNATLAEWIAIGARAAGVAPPRLRIPYVVAKAMGAMEVARVRVLGGTPLVTPDAVDVFRHEWAFSSEAAVKELGYTMTSLEEGIGRTVGFLRARTMHPGR